jgi:hypothetical protein
VTTWLARYQRFWDESHEQLDDLLAALQAGRLDPDVVRVEGEDAVRPGGRG